MLSMRLLIISLLFSTHLMTEAFATSATATAKARVFASVQISHKENQIALSPNQAIRIYHNGKSVEMKSNKKGQIEIKDKGPIEIIF